MDTVSIKRTINTNGRHNLQQSVVKSLHLVKPLHLVTESTRQQHTTENPVL